MRKKPRSPSAWRKPLESGGIRQRASLKHIGDVALLVSGFFSDSLNRELVDVDYYVSIGGCAYNALSRVETDTFRRSSRSSGPSSWGSWTCCLRSASARRASNADLLRLYEKWLKTGSRRSGQLLIERGSCPTPLSNRLSFSSDRTESVRVCTFALATVC
jgi:hypothetical protein